MIANLSTRLKQLMDEPITYSSEHIHDGGILCGRRQRYSSRARYQSRPGTDRRLVRSLPIAGLTSPWRLKRRYQRTAEASKLRIL